jgi:hypothetical protein
MTSRSIWEGSAEDIALAGKGSSLTDSVVDVDIAFTCYIPFQANLFTVFLMRRKPNFKSNDTFVLIQVANSRKAEQNAPKWNIHPEGPTGADRVGIRYSNEDTN